MLARLEVLVQFVDQGNSSWYVEREYILIRYTIEILDQCSQAIAVCSDDDFLAALNRWHDHFVPVRQKPSDGVLEALRARELRRTQSSVARISARDIVGQIHRALAVARHSCAAKSELVLHHTSLRSRPCLNPEVRRNAAR